MVGRNIIALSQSHNHEIIAPSSKEVNLMNFDSLSSFIKNARPDAIIHCAGLVGGIQANIKSPFDFAHINSLLGINIIKAALDNNVEKVLNLGSSCMYPEML